MRYHFSVRQTYRRLWEIAHDFWRTYRRLWELAKDSTSKKLKGSLESFITPPFFKFIFIIFYYKNNNAPIET